ncbi:MAG: redoxin family protein [Bacteroidota bacterium]|nr:redoxin family protein [Bacteroidota bacterium]
MRLLLLFGFVLTAGLIRAQVAPDFTVTDTDGQVHHLYADYLNQGKTVMIKVMFTTCPPCNSIAPLMEPFYQTWGAGANDVEFFEMTDKNFDTNTLMNAYAAQYNETFPAISMEGNALATVQPYKNGTFGQWSGTPTFIVIAPNGTVQFDVSGSGNQATINAIDAALTATGALKPGQSNLAPDFTITDSHGNTHHLYADYLNLGKSVLIEVFYTTCPPCNSIAPLMEPFYQDWGGGDHDVEFFELSDKNFDTDELVNAYQDNYEETFIGAGVDGGSLAAVQPYKSGQFGGWNGTPTFIVIAPDGTFQYDVDGTNNQTTITALDAALVATGAIKPDPVELPITVSGVVNFLGGAIGVGNAQVQIVNSLGNIVSTSTTNGAGTFNLQILLSEVQPGWEMKAVKDGNPLNGVNALDLVRIQKHILFHEELEDPKARIAADINKSGSISTLDNVGILKLLLGITTNFSDGQTWIVVPSDTDFGPPSHQAPLITNTTIPLADILSGARQPNWIAIKKGDANGNANPNE